MTTADVAAPNSSSGGGASTLTALDVAQLVGGLLVGDATVRVHAVAPIDRAGPNDISFLASKRYAPLAAKANPGVLLVTEELSSIAGPVRAKIIVRDPHAALLDVLPRLYVPRPRMPGIHATVVIGRGARVGRGVEIGPWVTIGEGAVVGERVSIGAQSFVGPGVAIGDDCVLFPRVTLYPGTVLGRRVTIHSGAVIGSDGFGYVQKQGQHVKVPHIGRCIIEDDVEIGANTTIDRGSVDDTVIGAGTKIDNLVQIGHNVRVGRLCLLMAQVGVAGSVRIGDGCILAGQVGVSGHLEIGDGVRLGAQAGVISDIPPGETWSGYPARPHREALRAQAVLFKLAKLWNRLEKWLAEER